MHYVTYYHDSVKVGKKNIVVSYNFLGFFFDGSVGKNFFFPENILHSTSSWLNTQELYSIFSCRTVTFLSPPVHFARYAHMRRFLSVCRLPGLDQKYWIIIHISKTNVFLTTLQ